jgi:hypothetical protein
MQTPRRFVLSDRHECLSLIFAGSAGNRSGRRRFRRSGGFARKACGGAHLGLALKAAEFRHALNRAIPERAAYRAWDKAVFHSRVAGIHARHKQRFPDFQAALTALSQDPPLPLRREIEVRLARLKARAICGNCGEMPAASAPF